MFGFLRDSKDVGRNEIDRFWFSSTGIFNQCFRDVLEVRDAIDEDRDGPSGVLTIRRLVYINYGECHYA